MTMHDPEINQRKTCLWQLFIDGASRNNPGLAGVGIYILKNEAVMYKHGFFIGVKTNNQAEYLALLIGTIILQNSFVKGDLVQIYSDSELLVRQMKGEYRVKDEELKKLQKVAFELLQSIAYDIGHVLREKNKFADSLANYGIDNKIRVPETILSKLNEHAISL